MKIDWRPKVLSLLSMVTFTVFDEVKPVSIREVELRSTMAVLLSENLSSSPDY